MKQITVLLADDHTIVRQGLRALLQAEPDIDVVGEAEDGRSAFRRVQEIQPDVVVMDIAMRKLGGIEAVRRIRRQSPRIKILILSMYADDEYVRQATEAGASGYLVKGSPAAELVTAIREVVKGNVFFSPAISSLLVEDLINHSHEGTDDPTHRKLTPREREVLQLIAEGLSNKEIAKELSISVKTVEKHRQRIMDKLNIHSVVGLTRHAIQVGIIRV
ncbi:MAG: response regulator transcription factor [Nitrospirae bacterium]|nr:response regulator transcription factor [Nitrospirota bacterium]